jgi:hypothetical protein
MSNAFRSTASIILNYVQEVGLPIFNLSPHCLLHKSLDVNLYSLITRSYRLKSFMQGSVYHNSEGLDL